MISKNYVRHIVTVLTISLSTTLYSAEAPTQQEGQIVQGQDQAPHNTDTKAGFLAALDEMMKRAQPATKDALAKIKNEISNPAAADLKNLLAFRAYFSPQVREELKKLVLQFKNDKKIIGSNINVIEEICDLPNAGVMAKISYVIQLMNRLKKS